MFLQSFKRSLTDFHFTKLEEIDNFDYSNVSKRVNYELGGVSKEYLEEGVMNLKRYYAVALLDPLNEHAVSASVDPFWHSHVLHTKGYMHFTQSIFNQYVHHEPLHKDNLKEAAEVEVLYDYTLNVYSELFIDINDDWWPINTKDKIESHAPGVCRHMYTRNRSFFGVTRGSILPSHRP